MEQGSNEGTSTTQNSSMTVEIKIKTLDSQDYTCHVDQNISIPALKEHVATLTGVPVERQRLICRGKVLKDDHNLSAYNVEDGHVLHLVTREVPQSGAPSGGNSRRTEEPGPGDPNSAGPRNRPGQVSHSVVLGTFSIPDHGEGGIPDVGRIISTVLSSLGVANLGQPNAGGNAGAVAGMVLPGPQPSAMDVQEVVGNIERASNDAGVGPSESGVAQGTESMEAAANTSRPAVDTVHPPGQQFRFMQPQVIPDHLAAMSQYANRIPDALATMSQYLNRLEQVFGTSAPVSLTAGNQTLLGAAEAAARTFPTPASLGSIIRRTMGLLSGNAGAELSRLASQLENEPSLAEVTARGEVQSSAMREGVLLQHFGALLLELGRAALTLRMGLSPAESFVNSGPAVFISQVGPNPMMVQPLPFQPGVGLNPLSGLTHQPFGAAGAGSPEMPRNINIHIHTNDAGMVPGLPTQPQIPLPVQGGLVVPAQVSRMGPFTGPGDGRMSAPSGGAPPERAPVPVQVNSTSGVAEQPGVRVVPMRTVVAAVPSALHGRPPPDNAGASLGLFYPLLARFQQLTSQQANGAAQGVPAGPPVAQGGAAVTDQSANPAAPTVRAQVQIQAWVPQLPDGQGGLRPLTNEDALHTSLPLSTQGPALMTSQQQQALEDSLEGRRQEPVPPSIMEQCLPADAVTDSGGQQSGLHNDNIETTSVQGRARSTADEVAKPSTEQDGNQARSLSNGENIADAATSSGSQPRNVSNVPVGLGLRGLQPLPPRAVRRSTRQPGGQEQSMNLSQQRNDLGRPSDTQGPPGGAMRLEGVPSSGAQIPAGISQLLNAMVNHGQPARGASNLDLGNMIPQVMGQIGGENSFAAPVASNDAVQGLGLPGGALGNILGQVMQSPLMRNMVQQMVEQVGDEPQGIQDAIAGIGSEGGLNFSGILQQMMPIVSQALGRGSTTTSDQPLASSISMGTGSRARENGLVRVDSQNAPSQTCRTDQGEMVQTRDETANTVEEEVTVDRSAETEVNSGCAPVAKRQKIYLEEAFEKVEQGSAPSDIVRVMTESAVASMALNDNPGRVGSQLSEYLLQDDLLVNEYVALLLRDLGGYTSADSTS